MMHFNKLPYLVALLVVLVGCTTSNTLAPASSEAILEDNTEAMKNRAAIMAFYEKALTVNSETRPTEVLSPVLAEGYTSSSSTDSKGAEQLMGQLEFFWKLIPDLKWDPQEIMNEGDVYIVRSIATGTPNGDFMGLPTDGTKSFKIMTIDMHTMKDGMFISTHHVEDWATAMGQLRPTVSPVDQSDETMKVAMAFMDSMGKGDMETMVSLMHDDMVWHNEGDKSMPWIGPWSGKKVILEEFMPLFGENFKTLEWETQDAISTGDTATFFGRMVGQTTKSGQQTKEFTWALRVKVKDEKIILWNWLEDSYEVSKSYHASE
ncbi:MAG: nuclear transport factor 2 family protein [Rhodothermaceae bacterium]|nr:nuclear transport factor 2 family protein [Rhodothermaceae bacterium]